MSRKPYSHKIIQLPYRGAPTTVGVIRDAALAAQNSYEVRELAEDICEHITAKDYVSEPLAICYFVQTHTRYMRDPRTVELVRDPIRIIKELRAGKRPSLDCDDMAALICALCLATGARVRVATVAFTHAFYNGERQFSHVFAQAYDPISKTWVTLDPVAGCKVKEMLGRAVHLKTWPVA